jgi:hypothetical protein
VVKKQWLCQAGVESAKWLTALAFLVAIASRKESVSMCVKLFDAADDLRASKRAA